MARRRGNGEGSIYRRADGRWVAAVSLGWAGGRRQRRTAISKTQRAAVLRLRELERAAEQGLPLPTERLTVGAYLERWLTDSARPSLRPRTHAGYESIVQRHLVPELGRIPLRKLGPADVEAYMLSKTEHGLSNRTVQYHHAVLRRALSQAERWGLVSRNVAKLVSPPRVIPRQVQPMTPNQARHFLESVRGDRLGALYAVALGLGLRQGEILGLTWADIDLDARTLTVRRALQRYGGRYHLDEPKSRSSRRTIILPSQIVEALRQHRSRQLEERLRVGLLWQGDHWNLVFCSELGEPLSGATVTRGFQEALQALGLPRQRFHDLRHTSATFLLAQGVPLRVAMEILGHSTIAVTANTYSHVMPQLQQDATERVGALLWGSP